jgi:hypothetical protein
MNEEGYVLLLREEIQKKDQSTSLKLEKTTLIILSKKKL